MKHRLPALFLSLFLAISPAVAAPGDPGEPIVLRLDGSLPAPSPEKTPPPVPIVISDPVVRPTPSETPTLVIDPKPLPAGAPSFVIKKTCATPCRMRDPSGKCLASIGEVCGPGYACAPRCISRDTSGKCMAYGEDFCAAGASCVPGCLFYTAGKVCSAYTSDTCTQEIVGTR